jgi:polyhydroxyalkanoate synthesis regulator phasin
MAEEIKKAAAKRKPAVKRKATAGRKPAAKRKPAARKASRKAGPQLATRAREAGREAFLASLGFYGKAYDQVQEQWNNLQDQLEERRNKADDLYKELVKRGEKVEKNARKAIDDIDLPTFELESLTDRKKLEAQLEKARTRFEELRDRIKQAA